MFRGKDDVVKPGDFQLTNEGFARRVEAELDALGYPFMHLLRVAARHRFKPITKEAGTHEP